MNTALKIFSAIILLIIAYFVFYLGAAPLIEGRNLINPYIDTEFAENFTPEKLEFIKVGMTEEEVIEKLGMPLSITEGVNNLKGYQYSKDGKLLESRRRHLINDFAWYACFINIENGKVTKIDKFWAFD